MAPSLKKARLRYRALDVISFVRYHTPIPRGSRTRAYTRDARALYAAQAELEIKTDHPEADEPTACEICLRRNVNTLLVLVDDEGLVSGDLEGDLVCGRCHPRVKQELLRMAMTRLVEPE